MSNMEKGNETFLFLTLNILNYQLVAYKLEIWICFKFKNDTRAAQIV